MVVKKNFKKQKNYCLKNKIKWRKLSKEKEITGEGISDPRVEVGTLEKTHGLLNVRIPKNNYQPRPKVCQSQELPESPSTIKSE